MRPPCILGSLITVLLGSLLAGCGASPGTPTLTPVRPTPTIQQQPLPAHLAWQPTALTTNLVALVPAEPTGQTLYAGGDRLYRSTDGGRTWAALPGDFAVGALSVAPSDSHILYAAPPVQCGSPPGPLYRSTDGGATWQPRPAAAATVLDVELTNPDRLLGTRCDGLYRSADAGQTWQRLPGTPPADRGGLFLVRAVDQPATLYAVYGSSLGTGTIQRSTDDGATWITLTDEYPMQPTGFAVDPVDARHIYLAERGGFFSSVEGGESWRLRVNGLYSTELRVWLGSLAVDTISPPPAQATVTLYVVNYLAGDTMPFPGQISRWNGVNTWDPVAPLPPGLTVHRLIVVHDPGGPCLVAATDHGIVRLPLY
jgi:photosystem II stability/assembly factor-like uncharacterized protein